MIAVTGASGFLGRTLCRHVAARGACRALIRVPDTVELGRSCEVRIVGDLSEMTDATAFAGCSAVIHAAARAHRMGESGTGALDAYRLANVTGTVKVLEAMRAAGVRRLVYVSSIKAVGERSLSGHPLRPTDGRHPEDAYGISKMEAEDVVRLAHERGEVDAVVVRPVLVHGVGVKGNLLRLLGAVAAGRYLPLGAIGNRRSLAGVENLCDALRTCATHPAAGGQTFHIADGGVISTRDLACLLADGLGVSPALLPIPRWLALAAGTLTGKGAMVRRLFDDMEVDSSDITRVTGWVPRTTLHDGLRSMAAAWRAAPW
jgi:UDP-glucose 4-epimerase